MRSALESVGVPEAVLAALARMTREHGPIDEAIAAATPLWLALVEAPRRRPELRTRLAVAAAWLDELFGTHLGPEESLIFPAMKRYRQGPGGPWAKSWADMRRRRRGAS